MHLEVSSGVKILGRRTKANFEWLRHRDIDSEHGMSRLVSNLRSLPFTTWVGDVDTPGASLPLAFYNKFKFDL